jgi:hypothetical protein
MSVRGSGARPAPAPPEEDPNVVVSCSSPPCYMHELDPSYLGYLGRDEVRGLLAELLAALPDGAGLPARLRCHAERFGGATPPGPATAPAGQRPRPGDPLARRLREALPRLQDEALRRDLEAALAMLEPGGGRQAPDPPQPPRG